MASTIRTKHDVRIPLEEILKATNKFSDENIIGEGGLSKVYKGQLLQNGELINVSVRRFVGRQNVVEFLNEMSMLSSFRSRNVDRMVSYIGFCAKGGELIIVNSYQSKGSLLRHLSDPVSFTWTARVLLSVDVAKAIRHLHGEKKRSIKDFNSSMHHNLSYLVIHRNINSSTILLDENMIPRLSGFEYSIRQSLDRKDHIHLCEAIGTRGYMDPAVLKNGGVIHKSDVYAFGVVLFEILCGRGAYQDKKLLVRLAKYHYQHGTLQQIILPDLWKQMEPNSFKYFSEAAYSCLETEWTQRPDIQQVLDELEKAIKAPRLDYNIQQEGNLENVKSALPKYGKNMENKTVKWEEQLKMCIDSANKLSSLHNEMEVQKTLIHVDINSGNIALDDNNLGAKIVGYRNSVFNNMVYMDPEFRETDMLCKESDVFGFGIHMFEMLCGYEAGELLKLVGHKNEGMSVMIRTWFNERKGSIGGVLLGGKGDDKVFINKGPNEESLSTFINIVCQCVEKKRNERPTMNVVVQELQKALTFQKNYKDNFEMSYEDVKLATQNFSFPIGRGGFGNVYKGKLANRIGKRYYPIVAKKLDTRHGQGDKEFYTELQILCEFKHENIIKLVGYSNDTHERIIVYEHATKGSLDNYLGDASLTWMIRLKICIDLATGLNFLHERKNGMGEKYEVIHRDIKSPNVLLFDDWKAKIGDFGLSMISSTFMMTMTNVCGTRDYVDPRYLRMGFVTKKSDIYSFGVVLVEILCGKMIHEIHKSKKRSLLSFVKDNFEEGKQDGFLFKTINEDIFPDSLAIYLDIVYRCLEDDTERRPSWDEVLEHLQRASNLQVSYHTLTKLGFI